MSTLENLNWRAVRRHYDQRRRLHKRLLELHDANDKWTFAELFVGVEDANANYSADEHSLGPKILISNGYDVRDRIFELATRFRRLKDGRQVPTLIDAADLSYLGISVGSEGSCMVNPNRCWVANTRSIWAHLLIKHDDNQDRANEELALYHSSDTDSEMAYALWAGIHREMDTAMTRLAEAGERLATAADVKPGKLKYLWADAVANALYERRRR